MPVREICQSGSSASMSLSSLCEQCCRNDSCPTPLQMRAAVDLNSVMINKQTIVADCPDFLPTAVSLKEGIGWQGLGPRLAEAGVNDLCQDCPANREDACDHQSRLALISLSATRTGRNLRLVTTCCSLSPIVRIRPNPGDVLHQISEPVT